MSQLFEASWLCGLWNYTDCTHPSLWFFLQVLGSKFSSPHLNHGREGETQSVCIYFFFFLIENTCCCHEQLAACHEQEGLGLLTSGSQSSELPLTPTAAAGFRGSGREPSPLSGRRSSRHKFGSRSCLLQPSPESWNLHSSGREACGKFGNFGKFAARRARFLTWARTMGMCP